MRDKLNLPRMSYAHVRNHLFYEKRAASRRRSFCLSVELWSSFLCRQEAAQLFSVLNTFAFQQNILCKRGKKSCQGPSVEKAVYFWFATNILTSCLNIQTLLSQRPDSQRCRGSFPLPLQASLPIMTLQIFILLRRLFVNVRGKSQVQIHRGEKHFGLGGGQLLGGHGRLCPIGAAHPEIQVCLGLFLISMDRWRRVKLQCYTVSQKPWLHLRRTQESPVNIFISKWHREHICLFAVGFTFTFASLFFLTACLAHRTNHILCSTIINTLPIHTIRCSLHVMLEIKIYLPHCEFWTE